MNVLPKSRPALWAGQGHLRGGPAPMGMLGRAPDAASGACGKAFEDFLDKGPANFCI